MSLLLKPGAVAPKKGGWPLGLLRPALGGGPPLKPGLGGGPPFMPVLDGGPPLKPGVDGGLFKRSRSFEKGFDDCPDVDGPLLELEDCQRFVGDC